MLMIPLPFVIALAALVLLLRELMSLNERLPNRWLIGFLSLFAFQEVLVGLRFGHGVEWLRNVQPFSAALIPSLAYLSFHRPKWSLPLLAHLLPLAFVVLSLFIAPGFLDAVLAVNNIIYAALLMRLGLRGSDALGWVEFRRMTGVMWLLWLVIVVLLVSGIADAAIVYDFMRTSGANTGTIAGWATVIGALVAALAFALTWVFKTSRNTPVEKDTDAHAQIFQQLDAMMKKDKLHLDPDINLNRIARRMVLPAREVSRAINVCTGNNVSQYINTLRIDEACRLLENSEMPITQIVFASGFNTKSNFNREFSRLKKQSPSEWRNIRSKTI